MMSSGIIIRRAFISLTSGAAGTGGVTASSEEWIVVLREERLHEIVLTSPKFNPRLRFLYSIGVLPALGIDGAATRSTLAGGMDTLPFDNTPLRRFQCFRFPPVSRGPLSPNPNAETNCTRFLTLHIQTVPADP